MELQFVICLHKFKNKVLMVILIKNRYINMSGIIFEVLFVMFSYFFKVWKKENSLFLNDCIICIYNGSFVVSK